MGTKKIILIGSFFALAAAAVNGSVGVFVRNLFDMGFDYYQVSFYKCTLAFFILLGICLCNANMRKELRDILAKPLPVIVCAFFGLFLLYFFETSAYRFMKVSEVVLILMVGSVLTTTALSFVLLRDKIGLTGVLAFILAMIGIFLLTDVGGNVSLSGGAIAFIAGVGYGGFLVLSRYFKIKATMPYLCVLFMFGSLYLMVPYLLYSKPTVPNPQATFDLFILAVFPTIFGFYFTTKALEYISSNKAQLIELTEPLFALMFAMVFLHEYLTSLQLAAMGLIIFALYVSESQYLKDFFGNLGAK